MSAAAPSSVSGSGTGSMHSEASKLLEAALEQMDGIIQGAKYDLPNAGGLPPGSGSTSGDWDSPSLGRRPRQVSDLSSALRQLRLSIVSNSSSSGVKHGSDAGWMDALDGEDSDNLNFISRWIQNNPRAWPQMGTSLQVNQWN